MPLINLAPPTPPTPPTPAQVLANSAAMYAQQMNNIWLYLQKTFQSIATFIWANPNATPQQAFDAFGVNAGDLFKLAGAYQAMVAAYTGAAPASPVPAGWSYVINPDGTVTVTAPATPTPPAS